VQLAAGALALAAGAEVRRESLTDTNYGPALEALGGVNLATKDGSRNVQAAYVELVAPLARGLEAQLAGRIDHYGDFGTTFNPKLALRIQPASAWLLRASFGRGFRAPSLPELFTAQTATSFTAFGHPDALRCPVTHALSDCVPVFRVVEGGNPALQPERSKQASVGLMFEPGAAWQIGVDAWSISVRQSIGTLELFQILDHLGRFEGRNVVRGLVDPAFPDLPGPITQILTTSQNLGSKRSTGIDLAVVLRPSPTPIGRVSVRLDGTYVRSARATLNGFDEVNLLADDVNGGQVPRWQHVLSLELERGAWTAALSQRYRHGYQDLNPLPDGSFRRVGAYDVWDARIGCRVSPTLKLTLGVQNLFDRDPPFTNGNDFFQRGYNPSYADPRGRLWTAALSATLRR